MRKSAVALTVSLLLMLALAGQAWSKHGGIHEKEPNNSCDDAMEIDPGEPLSATMDSGDHDWFVFVNGTGQDFVVTVADGNVLGYAVLDDECSENITEGEAIGKMWIDPSGGVFLHFWDANDPPQFNPYWYTLDWVE